LDLRSPAHDRLRLLARPEGRVSPAYPTTTGSMTS
jgi:hypothetical protein